MRGRRCEREKKNRTLGGFVRRANWFALPCGARASSLPRHVLVFGNREWSSVLTNELLLSNDDGGGRSVDSCRHCGGSAENSEVAVWVTKCTLDDLLLFARQVCVVKRRTSTKPSPTLTRPPYY